MADEVHPLCTLIRNLRLSAGWSLTQAADITGIPHMVLGAYERGDRTPPLAKIEQVLNRYGYTLVALPSRQAMVRLPEDMVDELRSIADVLEQRVLGRKMVPLPG